MAIVETPTPPDSSSGDSAGVRAQQLQDELNDYELAVRIAVLEATIFTC